ncbi:MAG: NAD(P)-dependent oxidoreductase, partial [Bacteroidota bacterium]
MKIGFIGLGIMGSRMAGHLLKAGHTLQVHNRSMDKAASLVEAGAMAAASPATAAQDVDVLITMVAHPEAVRGVAFGPEGFFASLPKGAIWMDCSTVHPSFSKEMAAEAAQRGIRMLDAPVAGSKNQAAEAVLAFIVGGAAEDLEVVRPLMEAMGSRVLHAGGPGMGTALKVVVNHLLAVTMVGFAEGIVLGESMGISKETLLKVIPGGPVAAPFLSAKKGKIEADDFEVEFPLKWIYKDLQMASQAAFDHGAALPTGNAAKEIYQLAVRQGLGEI